MISEYNLMRVPMKVPLAYFLSHVKVQLVWLGGNFLKKANV